MLKETQETADTLRELDHLYFGKHPHNKIGDSYEKECRRIKAEESKVDEERKKKPSVIGR